MGGRVLDPETKLDAVRNVGVKDGNIAVITGEKISGTETIDASGHIVAPGFIDMHHHNAAAPFGQGLALRDGVTTAMELEIGGSPVDDWYVNLEGKSRINFGATVGTMAVRERVLKPNYKTVSFLGTSFSTGRLLRRQIFQRIGHRLWRARSRLGRSGTCWKMV